MTNLGSRQHSGSTPDTSTMKNLDIIPNGPYCYSDDGLCLYWSKRHDKPEQENGYCDYLQRGGWDVQRLSLLWDQVKECGIRVDKDE